MPGNLHFVKLSWWFWHSFRFKKTMVKESCLPLAFSCFLPKSFYLALKGLCSTNNENTWWPCDSKYISSVLLDFCYFIYKVGDDNWLFLLVSFGFQNKTNKKQIAIYLLLHEGNCDCCRHHLLSLSHGLSLFIIIIIAFVSFCSLITLICHDSWDHDTLWCFSQKTCHC